MILRDTTAKNASVLAGVTQNQRSKNPVAQLVDAACFERLASCKISHTKEEKETNPLAQETVIFGAKEIAGPIVLGFQAIFSTIKTPAAAAQNGEPKQQKAGFEIHQIYSKKPAAIVQNFNGRIIDEKVDLEPKRSVLLPNNQHVSKQKLDLKIDLNADQINAVKQADILPIQAGNLVSENFAPPQPLAFRITDVPHVTRVQIDQTKRNAAGVLTSLELVLEPAELGRITARIQHEEGRVTLVLSAQHKAVAEDLAHDSCLLLRVLSDHIPGINKMAVFVQTETQQAQAAQGQSFAELSSGNNERKQFSHARENFNPSQLNAQIEVQPLDLNTTALHVRI